MTRGRAQLLIAVIVTLIGSSIGMVYYLRPASIGRITYSSEFTSRYAPNSLADSNYLATLDAQRVAYSSPDSAVEVAISSCDFAAVQTFTARAVVEVTQGLTGVEAWAAIRALVRPEVLDSMANENPDLDKAAASVVFDAASSEFCPHWYMSVSDPTTHDIVQTPRIQADSLPILAQPTYSPAPPTSTASNPPTRVFNTRSSDPKVQAWIAEYRKLMGSDPYESDKEIVDFSTTACRMVTAGKRYEDIRSVGITQYGMGNADSVFAMYATSRVYCSTLPTQ